MNATLRLLLAATTDENEQMVLRSVARRVGLIWLCMFCFQDNPAVSRPCQHCSGSVPVDIPDAPVLSVIPIESAFAAVSVAVCDDESGAEGLVAAINGRHNAPIVKVGAGIAYNPSPQDTDLLEHMVGRATGTR